MASKNFLSQSNAIRVSIIVPVFNGEETLARAIDSALAQTFVGKEIIVVDDGSTDSSLALLQRYGSKIRLVQQKNAGAARARNLGIDLALGEYLAFLDQDDFWAPQKLAHQVEFLDEHPSIGLTFSNLEAVNRQGEKLGFSTVSPIVRSSPSWQDLLMSGMILPSAVLVRRELALQVGGFDSDTFPGQGYAENDFFLRLREITDFHYLDMCLTYYVYEAEHRPTQLMNIRAFAQKYWNHPLVQRDAEHKFRNGFANRCAFEMRDRMMIILTMEGGHVSLQMLDRLNEFCLFFQILFGESHAGFAQLRSLNLENYELTPAVSLLLYLFLCRPDLQIAFPEVFSGKLSKLIWWGYSVAKGDCGDSAQSILFPYMDELKLRKPLVSRLIVMFRRVFNQYIA